MFKRIIGLKIILLAVIFTSGYKLNAKNNIELILNLGDKQEIITLNSNKMTSLNYDSRTLELTIMEDHNTIKVYKIKDGDNYLLNTQLTGNMDVRGNYNAKDFTNINFNKIKVVFNSEDDIVIYNGNTIIYEDAYEIEINLIYKLFPAVSGKDYIITDVDKPYTTDEIMKIAEIKALDDYDGDITSDITYNDKDYIDNKNKLGVYQIIFEVKNSSGLKSKYTLNVKVVDLKAPIITGPKTLTYSYTLNLALDDIVKEYSVKDNYDEDLSINIDNNKNDLSKPGKYKLSLSSEDKSGNKTTENIEIEIIDDVKPVIEDENEGKVTINYKDKIDNNVLLLGLKASDEIDGDLTKSIKVVENNIKPKIGEYIVKYEVEDKAKNKETFERVYKVISTDLPQFYVSKNILTIEDINNMSNDQLAELLSEINNIKMKSYEVTYNEYNGNEDKTGLYNLSIKIKDIYNNEHIIDKNIRVFNKDELNNYNNKSNNNYKYLIIGLIPLTVMGIYIYKNKDK